MRYLLLLALLACSAVHAQSVVLSWSAPTQYTDNSPIPAGTAFSYRVCHFRVGADENTQKCDSLTALRSVRNPSGPHCYAVYAAEILAVDGSLGPESSRSALACMPAIPPPAPKSPPRAPHNLALGVP